MTLYMAVSNDKYELPCYVAETGRDLARVYGISECNMWGSMREGRPYKKLGVRFVKVEV